MEDLCVELMGLEQFLVERILTFNDGIIEDPKLSERMKLEAEHRNHDLNEIHDQMREIFRGDFGFHEKYPEDRYLIRYWRECLNLLNRFTRAEQPETWARDSLKRIEAQSHNLETQLIDTAGHIELPMEVQSAIQHKWMKLTEGLAMHDGSHILIRCQTWYAFAHWYAFTTVGH